MWADVLVDCPGTANRAFDTYIYRVPSELVVSSGDIVGVPFGAQLIGGVVIRILTCLPNQVSAEAIKPIESVINKAFFTKGYWQLLIRVEDYYQTPLIRIVRAALPPGLLSRTQRRVRLCQSISSETVKLSGYQSKLSQSALLLIETLNNSETKDYSWQYLKQKIRAPRRTGTATQALQQLLRLGWVESYLATPRSPQPQKRQAVFLTRTIESPASGLTARQQELVHGLARCGGELWLSDALQQLKTTSQTLKKIEALGYLVIAPRERLRSSSHSTALPDQPKQLTQDQSAALSQIQQIQGYEEVLLHGVTGSGKTEVYLQAIAPHVQARKSALVLVPEIGLTPQLTDRFRSRFGELVCVYHSGLSEGERYDTWRQMLSGEPQIIIGTRSAVFAPLPNIGIIILDEEHDSSFKQDQPMPCYHAGLVARWRAELENCPLVLGSATPSLETWIRFKPLPAPLPQPNDSVEGEFPDSARLLGSTPSQIPRRGHYLCLPTRVHAQPLPPIEIVDMRKELHEGNRTIFSRTLQTALETLVETGNQGILFIHRRGHSSFVSCRSCGHVMECPNCDVSLSYHQTHAEAAARLQCHYCGVSQAHPSKCPKCLSPYLKKFGSGTQRVVNDLAKYLPQIKCIRFDSDTTRNKGAHRALLARFARGEANLLVGTQMLTKGIDLPQVVLVGVIAADGLLFMPDFRASERAYQTLTQVAGRAGRGEQPGRVIVQTYSPENAVIQALRGSSTEDEQGISMPQLEKKPMAKQQAIKPQMIDQYEQFLQQELRDRAELQYPPFGRLILLRLSGLEPETVEKAAARLADKLEAINLEVTPLEATDKNTAASYELLGPVPAPIHRVARRYRWHILLKLAPKAPLPNLTRLRPPKGISLTIDVDPLNLS
ncbi:primosomal protein N', putative [Synechococcus sp. PCC 7335]|nr:primosomal protein N', putative [Synechococcus sp. PCC 7335]